MKNFWLVVDIVALLLLFIFVFAAVVVGSWTEAIFWLLLLYGYRVGSSPMRRVQNRSSVDEDQK